MSRFAERVQVQAREAALQRLCRVRPAARPGAAVRFEVRVPTPENLATVSQLLRKAYRRCRQASGIVFLAEA